MKKIFAMILSLVLVIGLVPSLGTVKAAGEVNTILSYGGYADQPNVGTGRWLIYADLDTEMTAEITSVVHYVSWAFASVNDSSEEFSMDVYAQSQNRIFYTMKYSSVGASTPSEVPVGTTVTIKARTMSGYMAPQNDFTIYWDGSAWKEIIQAGVSAISSQQQAVLTTTNDVLQSLFDSKGSTSDMPLTAVGDAGVYLNGTKTTKTSVNYSRWGLYLDSASIKGSNYVAGDIITVRGLFSQNVNANVYLELDESYICAETTGDNGATWVYYSPMSIKINRQNVLYLAVDDVVAKESDYNVFGSTGASVTYNDEAICRSNNNYFLYTSSENALYLSLGECGVSEQNAGDILAISGVFNCNGKGVSFGENWFVLQEDGTWLQVDEKPEVHVCQGVKTDEVAATCVMPGNIAYWTCECGKIYVDEACENEITIEDTVVEPIAHEIVHQLAIEPNCHYNGQIEHWYCSECGTFWQDEARTQITNALSVVLPKTGSDKVEHVEAKESTCDELGNVEYWYCPDCEGFWTDELCTVPTNALSVRLPLKEHNVIHVEAIEPNCHMKGNDEHWYCSVCRTFWADEALTQITNALNVVRPAVGSDNLTHVEAKAPTCVAEGNIEYWHCPDCEQFWQDAALTQLTNVMNVKLGTVDHKAVKLPAVAAQIGKTGLTEGSKCSVCNKVLVEQKIVAAKPLAAPKASKVTKATGGKKKITVKFKKVSDVTRYEIQIATKKNMKKGLKTVKVTKAKDMKNAKFVVKKLKAKTAYYVRIRTVKTVNGVTKTSKWSKVVKATKTK